MKVLETGYMAQILLKISELQDNVPKKKKIDCVYKISN